MVELHDLAHGGSSRIACCVEDFLQLLGEID